MPAAILRMTPALYRADSSGRIVQDISDYVTSGSVTWDLTRDIPMTLSARLRERGIVAPYADYLIPRLQVDYADGTTVASNLGLFTAALPKVTLTPTQGLEDIDGRDLTWRLAVDAVTTATSYASGANIVSTVGTLISSVTSRYALPASSATLPEARSYDAGTTKLRIVNDLLSAAGYYPIYADKDGYLRSMAYRTLANVQPATTYRAPATGNVRVLRTVDLEPIEDALANKITVIRDQGTDAAYVKTITNNNPASPTSTVTLGATITKVVRNGRLASNAAADALARRLAEEASTFLYRIKLQTTPDPARSPHEVYALDIRNDAGAVVADGSWWCTAWTIGFTPDAAVMTHTLNRLVTYE